MTIYCGNCGEPKWEWQQPHECTEYCITSEIEENQSFWVERPEMIMHDKRRDPMFEEVAEAWAKWYNEDGDYSLMNDTMIILITKDDETRKFRVSAEPTIDYITRELDTSEETD